MASRHFLVEVLLEPTENLPNLFRSAQVGYGVGDGIVVLEFQQRRKLFLVQFLHADFDVLGKYKVEEDLLLGVEMGADYTLALVALSSRVSGGKA